MSDAGMPTISDPGKELISFCNQNNIEWEFYPGANACLLAFCMSPFDNKEFTFFGFLHEKQQKRLVDLKGILRSAYPTIIYESPKRLLGLLDLIASIEPNRKIFVTKELTKLYEKSFFGTAMQLKEEISNFSIKGEWTLVIDSCEEQEKNSLVDVVMDLDLKPKDKAKILAKISTKTVSQWYEVLTN